MEKHLLQPVTFFESEDVSHSAIVTAISENGDADLTIFKPSGHEYLKAVPIATDKKTIGCWQPN